MNEIPYYIERFLLGERITETSKYYGLSGLETSLNVQMLNKFTISGITFYNLYRNTWAHTFSHFQSIHPIWAIGLAKPLLSGESDINFQKALKSIKFNPKNKAAFSFADLTSSKAINHSFRVFADIRWYIRSDEYVKLFETKKDNFPTIFREFSVNIIQNNFFIEPYLITANGIRIVGIRIFGVQLSTHTGLLRKINFKDFEKYKAGITVTPFVILKDKYNEKQD